MSADDIARLRSDVETMLGNKDCRDFINSLVKKGLERNASAYLEENDLLSVFDKVEGQARGGYFWVANMPGTLLNTGPTSGAGGYSTSGFKWNTAKTALGDASFFTRSYTPNQLRVVFAVGALHETIHHYTHLDDTQLSVALATILGADTSKAAGSLYWGQPLDTVCGQALTKALKK
jgi:hypothetical protein